MLLYMSVNKSLKKELYVMKNVFSFNLFKSVLGLYYWDDIKLHLVL